MREVNGQERGTPVGEGECEWASGSLFSTGMEERGRSWPAHQSALRSLDDFLQGCVERCEQQHSLPWLSESVEQVEERGDHAVRRARVTRSKEEKSRSTEPTWERRRSCPPSTLHSIPAASRAMRRLGATLRRGGTCTQRWGARTAWRART